ncbi:MAG: hypothetical protein ACTSYI_01145 [Promethearchaeota archaeon]
MKSIKCDTCIYLGGRHEKGVIHVQSGALPIYEPYATCLKRQYFVLEREVERCEDFKQDHEKIKIAKVKSPYDYTTEDILKIIIPNEWIPIQEVTSRLKLSDQEQIRYLPLKLKSMLNKKELVMKFGSATILYSRN